MSEQEADIEIIVDTLEETSLQDFEERIQKGIRDTDAFLLDYIQKLPTITVTAPTIVDGTWKTMNKKQLIKFITDHDLLQEDEDYPDTVDEMKALISRILSKPATLNPLFKSQRRFKENIKRLHAILCKLLLLMKELPEHAKTDTLRKAITQAETLKGYSSEEKFYIMVLGELKAGKSTCLNFLLEDEVLPTSGAACTVVITELHYGETKKLVTIDRKTGESHEQNIDWSKGRASDLIAEFLKRESPDRSNPVFSKLILEIPSPILKAGIVFVDTPGLNENKYLEGQVDSYMKQAVGVLCILNTASDGGKVKLNLQPWLEQLGKMDGMEVAFICNRIDQVDNAEQIVREFAADIQLYYPKFRSELIIPFNSRGALLAKQQGIITPEQTTFIDKMVNYFEISFRSRLQCLFNRLLSYSSIENPVVQCFKFDLQSICNVFGMSHQNREKIAQILNEMVDKQWTMLKHVEGSTSTAIHKAIAEARNKYNEEIKLSEKIFIEYAAAQIDLGDDDADSDKILMSRLLEFFAKKLNLVHHIKENCLKTITYLLNLYANQAKSVLDDLQQFCLRKWTTKLLQIWENAGDETKETILSVCLDVAVDYVSVNMTQPIPVTAKTLPMASFTSLIVWNLHKTDTWRRDLARTWLSNDVYTKLVPEFVDSVQTEAEAILNGLTKVVEERLLHTREFINNINRQSISRTFKLCRTLSELTAKIEEDAAEFSFMTVQRHLTNVAISEIGKLGLNLWHGKWAEREVMLRKLENTDAAYYSRFLEQHRGLDHPNILKFYGTAIIEEKNSDSTRTTPSRFLVTEFVPNNLQEFLPDLDATTSENILLDVVQGAEHIHSKNLMHFDLSPNTILLTADLSPKISDLDHCSSSLLSKTHCKQKKMNLAPEMVSGDCCSPGVDIFAFGNLIKHVYSHIPIPSYMQTLAEKCTCVNPSGRPKWSVIREIIQQKKIAMIDDEPTTELKIFTHFGYQGA